MGIIEIRDSHLDKNAFLKRIAVEIDHKIVPDFASIGPERLRQAPANAAAFVQGAESSNHEALIDLMVIHQLEEPEFSSEAPIIGSLIVQLRKFWNWMSTKWYVRPIIRQQTTVNGQIAILLLEMEAWMNEKNKIITDLQEKVNRLESTAVTNRDSE